MQATEKKKTLTRRQLEVLKAIKQFENSQRYSATIGELAEQLGVSRSTVFEHVSELRRKGLVSSSPNRARSSRLTARANRLLKAPASPSPQKTVTTDEVPLVGRVAAGEPIEAIEDNRSLSMSSLFGNRDDVFALEVVGESMIEEGIFSGDYAICQKRPVANNGELVVAIVDDGSATLKRFYHEKTHVRLQPANEEYLPIHTRNCRVEAVVLGIVRKV